MIWYAFGAAGNIDIAYAQPTEENIQKFNHEADEIERKRINQAEQEKVQQERSVFRLR